MKRLILISLFAIIFLTGCQSASICRPVIGVTSVYQINHDNDLYSKTTVSFAYIRAITEAGGTPVILPTVADKAIIDHYVETIDGLLLIGGADIPPAAYGQEPHETVVIMPDERYDFESTLIPIWLKTGKPTLGVCLGMQFTNVASGGTLIQDIPSQVKRNATHRGKNAHHQIAIEPDSDLAKHLGTDRAVVYSSHHQAVSKLGKNLKIIARSPDGVPEAMQRTDGPFGLFVQWHPELMQNEKHRKAIYSALINACK